MDSIELKPSQEATTCAATQELPSILCILSQITPIQIT
jgi:hypothetical protein